MSFSFYAFKDYNVFYFMIPRLQCLLLYNFKDFYVFCLLRFQRLQCLLFMFMSGTIIILTFYNSFLLIIIVISTAKLLFTTSLFDRKIFLIWQKRKKVIMVWAKWGCSLNYVNTKGRKKKNIRKLSVHRALLWHTPYFYIYYRFNCCFSGRYWWYLWAWDLGRIATYENEHNL